MNILPKKRWHVRTKENIARVRKDEAEAAAKEKEERLRIENADREARLSILKHKSKQKLLELGVTDVEPEAEVSQPVQPREHINLFTDSEHAVKTSNKEHDKEVKEKQEDYEKKIGYLTYLGQDTNEALKKKNWYEVAPSAARFSRSEDIKDTYDKLVLRDEDGKPKTKESDVKNGEVAWKAKQRIDPIQTFIKHCTIKTSDEPKPKIPKHIEKEVLSPEIKSKSKRKSKKQKKDKDDKRKKLLKLREDRLKREQQEKFKTQMFLSGLNPTTTPKPADRCVTKVKPKYNSQFNPELARQNFM